MKKIAVVTSGGDAPGMNAAIRAVVRKAIESGLKVIGIQRGFYGLVNNEMIDLDSRSVSGIINLGGTILRTCRFPELKEKSVQLRAVQLLRREKIDGLVVIGGNGSAQGAYALSKAGFRNVILIPASIDNDIYGTDTTIGFDTAVNTAVSAIDKIRDTATSHERIFIVEVMGRERGFIALAVAIASGSEIALIPEVKIDYKELCDIIERSVSLGKKSFIIITAEGAIKAEKLSQKLTQQIARKQMLKRSSNGLPLIDIKCSVLGYIQRGGVPTAISRILATEMGVMAVESLIAGNFSKVVCVQKNKLCLVALKEVAFNQKEIDIERYRRLISKTALV